MNREQLIQSIVARKLASGDKKAFCISCICICRLTVQKASHQSAAKASQ